MAYKKENNIYILTTNQGVDKMKREIFVCLLGCLAYQPLEVIQCQIHFIQTNSSISNNSFEHKYTV